MEDFRTHAQALAEGLRTDRHDHEFLEVDGVVSMNAAIDDVHHRNGKHARGSTTDVAIERQARSIGSRLGSGKRHPEDGVGAEARLVGRAVEFDHRLVDGDLVL